MEQSPVSEDRGRKRGEGAVWTVPLTGFAAVAILLAAYLCQFAQIVSCQYTLVELREERRVLEREQSELELEIQELTSLERVEQVALTRLGMVVPDERELLEIKPKLAVGLEGHVAALNVPAGKPVREVR